MKMFLVEFEHFILNVLLRERDFIKRQHVALFLVRLTIQSQHTSSSRASERASERAAERPSVRQRVSESKNANETNQQT
jgi:hypothetical protein